MTMTMQKSVFVTLFCCVSLLACSANNPVKETNKQATQSSTKGSAKVNVPSWYPQHKNIKPNNDKYLPLFTGTLSAGKKATHTIASKIEYHAIGVAMNGKSNTQGKVGFTQINGSCGMSSSVKSGGDLLGGFGSCSPTDGKIKIEVFNDSNQTVEYVVYDGQKAKGK
jgi:hypothetical protein